MPTFTTNEYLMDTFQDHKARAQYGERCLPAVFDEICEVDPHRLYAVLSKSSEPADGFRNVTFGEMAHCVDYFSSFLQRQVGLSASVETIAYIGVPDLRNAIVFLGSVKCGYKLLMLSPRNNSAVNAALLSQTKCTKLLHSAEMVSATSKLQGEVLGLQVVSVIALEEMFQQEGTHLPCTDRFPEAKGKPVLILHSSGSTGVPKPITMTHGTWATFDYCRNLPTIPERKKNDFTIWDSDEPRPFYSAFPPSHFGGFYSMVVIPIFSEASYPVIGPPLRPASGQLVKKIVERQNLKGLLVPPALVDQILQETGGPELCKGLDFVYTAGGPLSRYAGELISQASTLCQFYGSTETSLTPQLVPLHEDWEYMEWHPGVKHEMRATDSDGSTFELVLFADSSTEKILGLNHNVPEAKEWSTRDLFMPHPSKPGLWRYHGRKDDVIVFSNGEKLFPVPMEATLSGHPLISGALIIGQGRFQAALLVEFKAEVPHYPSLVDQIWPAVETANLLAPGQGRIKRAAKGSIIRKLTEKDYGLEIEALYSDEHYDDHFVFLPILTSVPEFPAIEKFVRSVVLLIFANAANASNDEDLFVRGLDSLKTLEIVGLLKASLRKRDKSLDITDLSSKTIYNEPSVARIASVVDDLFKTRSTQTESKNKRSKVNRAERMAKLVERYTQHLPHNLYVPARALAPRGTNVAMTGSTGSLGMQLVRALCRDPQVAKIYCLDRVANAQQRHQKVGIQDDSFKLHYLQTTIGQDRLGIGNAQYDEMTANIDVIIHSAWKVDFGQTLESFEHDHIRGVRRVIDLSLDGARRPRVIFISSVSSVSNWTASEPDHSVPEALVSGFDAPARMGYGESKHVAEMILATASGSSQVPVSVLRVGQIAGSSRTDDPAWPVQEWVPSLVKTARASGLLPEDLPAVDWIPIDKLAAAVIELMHHDLETDGMQFYNLVNPRPIPWTSLSKPILGYCGPATQLVPLKAWLKRLQETEATPEQFAAKPALKMLDFFTEMIDRPGLRRHETSRSVQASPTMATMQPISAELMALWLKQWAF